MQHFGARQRRLFSRIAVIAALGLGASAFWSRGLRGDDPFGHTSPAFEPFFHQVVVAPGDDPSAIPLPVAGANLIEIERIGTLLVHTGARVRRQPRPRAYQDIDGRRREVSVRFDIAPTGDPRLVVGPYDRTVPLVIESRPERDDL